MISFKFSFRLYSHWIDCPLVVVPVFLPPIFHNYIQSLEEWKWFLNCISSQITLLFKSLLQCIFNITVKLCKYISMVSFPSIFSHRLHFWPSQNYQTYYRSSHKLLALFFPLCSAPAPTPQLCPIGICFPDFPGGSV